jgi:hypothetical protein
MRRISRLSLIATAVAVLAVSVAGPVSAFTPSSFGTKFRCVYVSLSSSPWEIELRRLDVLPPDLDDAATAGKTRGWRFIVQRDGEPTYRSGIQWATADGSGHFASSKRSVQVAVPSWPGPEYLAAYAYRVVMKIYRPTDSGARLIASGGLYESRMWIDGERAGESGDTCMGRERENQDV